MGKSMPRFFSRQPPFGQGALEYLLLIAGVVLVATVVLLVLFTSVIPSGQGILQNNLSAINQTIPGYGGVPPAYSGPLTLDWSSTPAFTYDDIHSSGVNTISGVSLTNTGTQDVVIASITPTFSFSSTQIPVSPLPSALSQLTIRDGSNTLLATLSNASSNQSLTLPAPLTLHPSETWTISLSFNQAIFPQYLSLAYGVPHPSESAQRVSLSFADASNTIHRPSVYYSFLTYEDGLFSGSLHANVQTCNGASVPVGGTQTSVGIITDWCEQNAGSCAYQNDIGYSTHFVFPSSNTIPSTSSWEDATLFMTQLTTIVTGTGSSHVESEPYAVLKNNAPCDGSVFDALVETNPSYPSFSEFVTPSDLDENPNEVKFFRLSQTISPGDASVDLTLVGGDYDSPTHTHSAGVHEGWRQWQTGYNTSVPTPTPFLLVRYAAPN